MIKSARSYEVAVFLIFLLIAGLHALGFAYSLYYHLWWYDVIMHLLGGFAIALLAGYLFFMREWRWKRDMRDLFTITLSSILIVGTAWEVFEYFVDTYLTLREYGLADTGWDYMNDVIGALVGALYFKVFYKRLNPEKSRVQVEAKILL